MSDDAAVTAATPAMQKFMVLAGGAWFPVHAVSESEAREKCISRGLLVQWVQLADREGPALVGETATMIGRFPPGPAVDASVEEIAAYFSAVFGRKLEIISPEETVRMDAERDVRRIEQLTRDAGFPTLHAAISLAGYCEDPEADAIAAARASEWLSQLDEPDGVSGLLIYGQPGSGKTTLAEALGRQWIASQSRDARFIVVAHLLELMRRAYANNETEALFGQVLRVPLLILDDLGAERPTEWSCERLYEVVNERLSHRLPTIYTSNLSLDQLETRLSQADPLQGPRIAWRVKEHCWAEGRKFVVAMAKVNFRARH